MQRFASLNQATEDWRTRVVTLSETKGLSERFFALLRMTRPKGPGVKWTKVVYADLALFYTFVVLLVAGCSSTPSHYYTLSAVTEPAATSSSLSLVVGPVSVPAEVDRPQMVVSTGPNQVQVDEFNLWASPLQNSIAHVVAENLVVLLGTPNVTLFPQTVSADADYRVAIEVQRFDSTLGDAATLDAVWTVRRMKSDKTEKGRTTMRETAQENSYDALAASHSRAVARLSRDIANAVQALERSAP